MLNFACGSLPAKQFYGVDAQLLFEDCRLPCEYCFLSEVSDEARAWNSPLDACNYEVDPYAFYSCLVLDRLFLPFDRELRVLKAWRRIVESNMVEEE